MGRISLFGSIPRETGPLEWHPPLVGRIQPSDQTSGHRHARGEPDDDQHHLFRAQWDSTRCGDE